MLHLPENFESYNQARKNGFLKMKELKEAGQRIIVDIGGQDTKVIHIQDGQVSDFLMNDK